MFRLLPFCLSLALLAALPAAAQDADRAAELKELEAAVRATQDRADKLAARQSLLARESEALSDELKQVAADAEAWEREVADVERTLQTLLQETGLRREELAVARGRLSAMAGALLRISLLPPEVLAMRPAAPGEMVRAGLVMRRMMPRLEAEAAQLRHQVADLKGLEEQIRKENAEALAARERLQGERERLASLLQRRRELLEVTESERAEALAEARALSASVQDMQGLIGSAARRVGMGPPQVPRVPPKDGKAPAALAIAPLHGGDYGDDTLGTGERQSRPRVAATAVLRDLALLGDDPGGMTWPVSGRVVQRFDEGREERAGLRLAGEPGATVVSPYDAVVVYAGPFDSYGLVLILEHSGGYHSVLAELGSIHALLGQRVVAGEPVGALTEGSEGNPELYVELRRSGGPVDPEPWFAPARQQ
ncbi:MAG: peptidoglycan DD-metalloendopeptidase family protein [Rhodospirillales bacterium]|nr:peptidoglycan DD-metalloendopeptidase family protein [Rhodospirillales bacterium]